MVGEAPDPQVRPSGQGEEETGDTRPKSKNTTSFRKGKWTPEEEEYTTRIIHHFSTGLLTLPDGTTLRAYLAEKLGCDPMRISKKFSGAACLGKRVFHPCQLTAATMPEMEAAQRELDELEKRFHKRLESHERRSRQLLGGDPHLHPPAVTTTPNSSSTSTNQYPQPTAQGEGEGCQPSAVAPPSQPPDQKGGPGLPLVQARKQTSTPLPPPLVLEAPLPLPRPPQVIIPPRVGIIRGAIPPRRQPPHPTDTKPIPMTRRQLPADDAPPSASAEWWERQLQKKRRREEDEVRREEARSTSPPPTSQEGEYGCEVEGETMDVAQPQPTSQPDLHIFTDTPVV